MSSDSQNDACVASEQLTFLSEAPLASRSAWRVDGEGSASARGSRGPLQVGRRSPGEASLSSGVLTATATRRSGIAWPSPW